MIFNRSSGLTTVREAAPAHPPAKHHRRRHTHRSGREVIPSYSPTKYEATSGVRNTTLFFAADMGELDEEPLLLLAAGLLMIV